MKSYLRILRNHKRPLRFIAGRALVKSGLCTRLTIPQDGYRLRFYPSNLSEQLWVDRSWREPELQLIRAYLRVGDHVIDVGANVGDTALAAALEVGAERTCMGDRGASANLFVSAREHRTQWSDEHRGAQRCGGIRARPCELQRRSPGRHEQSRRYGRRSGGTCASTTSCRIAGGSICSRSTSRATNCRC